MRTGGGAGNGKVRRIPPSKVVFGVLVLVPSFLFVPSCTPLGNSRKRFDPKAARAC